MRGPGGTKELPLAAFASGFALFASSLGGMRWVPDCRSCRSASCVLKCFRGSRTGEELTRLAAVTAKASSHAARRGLSIPAARTSEGDGEAKDWLPRLVKQSIAFDSTRNRRGDPHPNTIAKAKAEIHWSCNGYLP